MVDNLRPQECQLRDNWWRRGGAAHYQRRGLAMFSHEAANLSWWGKMVSLSHWIVFMLRQVFTLTLLPSSSHSVGPSPNRCLLVYSVALQSRVGPCFLQSTDEMTVTIISLNILGDILSFSDCLIVKNGIYSGASPLRLESILKLNIYSNWNLAIHQSVRVSVMTVMLGSVVWSFL